MAIVTITLVDEKDGGVSIKVQSDPTIPINIDDYSDAQFFASEMVGAVTTALNVALEPASSTVN